MPKNAETPAPAVSACSQAAAANLNSQQLEVVTFLKAIGIPVQVVPELGQKGFLPGVLIQGGGLQVTPAGLVSDWLHEAGHVACVPTRFRGGLTGNVSAGVKAMFEQLDPLELDPDHPLMRAALQCSDPEATAWAWAAGCHLGLPPEMIIGNDQYDGDGAEIRAMLQANAYFGINGLVHAGMCQSARRPGGYPQLTKWLQDADTDK